MNWDVTPSLPGSAALHDTLRGAKTTDSVVFEAGDVEHAFADGVHTLRGSYHAPYQAHAPFGPSCALADVENGQAIIKCSSQDVFALRDRIAAVLDMPKPKLRVQYIEGSG